MEIQMSATRAHRGRLSHLAGRAAEEVVRRHYCAQGAETRARRWRGQGGEIDLIFEQSGETVFVEVKAAADCAAAAARIGPRQVARLWTAAEEYMTSRSGLPSRDCRFDVALVDSAGRVEVVENAFA